MDTRRVPAGILTARAADQFAESPVIRPSLPRRIFQVQNMRNALRCQASNVSGLTITSAERHAAQTRESPIHNRRSELFNSRRFFAER